jgi:hypothetical protein
MGAGFVEAMRSWISSKSAVVVIAFLVSTVVTVPPTFYTAPPIAVISVQSFCRTLYRGISRRTYRGISRTW